MLVEKIDRSLLKMGSAATSGIINGRTNANSVPGAQIGGDIDTVIQPNAALAVVGLGPHNFFGKITNYGILLVTQVLAPDTTYPGLTADYESKGEFYQYGDKSFTFINDIQADSGAHYFWNNTNYVNQGYFAMCGNGGKNDSEYQFSIGNYFNNEGMISLEQTDKLAQHKTVLQSRNNTPLYNYGTIRLSNVDLEVSQNLQGNGCIVLENSQLDIDSTAKSVPYNFNQTVLIGQTVYMKNTSILHLESQLYTENRELGFELVGFGAKQEILFDESVQSVSYANGVLTVKTPNQRLGVLISIGDGYDESKFSVQNEKTVVYNGDSPTTTAPALCRDYILCPVMPRNQDDLTTWVNKWMNEL